MPFRPAFDCLWCGAHHAVRAEADLEGWASLCPDCIGRADDNGFLRARVRAALSERSAAARPAASPGTDRSNAPGLRPAVPHVTESSTMSEDWYLRRGSFSAGPIVDGPWQMELDEATRWLDGLPLSGTIVELAAGTGWWSTLLAGKGELWMYEADEASLEKARQRLVAHGLLAHLHVRDPLSPPERPADAVFSAYLLGSAADEQGLQRRLALVRSWLRPGGRFIFLDAVTPTTDARAMAGPRGPLYPRHVDSLHEALLAAGFGQVDLARTRSAFVLGTATTPD